MKIVIFANTPAQVHFYNNIIIKLKEDGHQVKILIGITERRLKLPMTEA